ncbi:MAG: nucleotide exchange factor GrpE [Actinomycetaceae bacterium]|nr:nucleotide exchange factor GrpE [Actinomycetaceae bacterium]
MSEKTPSEEEKAEEKVENLSSSQSSECSCSDECTCAKDSDDVESVDIVQEAEELTDPLTEAMKTISRLEDDLARARADHYNLQTQYNNFVKRSRADAQTRFEEGVSKVLESLIEVLDDAQLAREHDDLEGPAGKIVEKLEQNLLQQFKLERFGAVGDTFDPQYHEALMNTPSADVSEEQVGTLIQPGYKVEDKVIRPARVGVLSPQ